MLDIDNISFSYRSGQGELPVINRFSICLKPGEIVCLLGPSGCGKSTLLKLASGFLKPDKGEIYFHTRKVDKPFKEGQVIFQDDGQLLPWLTVEENIIFPLKKSLLKDMGHMKMLQQTDLTDFRKYYPSRLSGGMKKRTVLARALIKKPDILFMDESFASLDAPGREKMQNLLLSLWRQQKTSVFFVTHDITEALFLADRLLVFKGLNQKVFEMENLLPRPRYKGDKAFMESHQYLYSLLENPLNS